MNLVCRLRITNHISHIKCSPKQISFRGQPDISRFLQEEKDKASHFSPQVFSSPQMASLGGRFSYRRLRNEGWSGGGGGGDDRVKTIRRAKSWSRLRRVSFRKRFRLKIPSLRRFLRRKARVVSISWGKILKRLKEGQSHFGDLFAGNYLFMQVTPTPVKCLEKSWKAAAPPHLHQYQYPPHRIA